MSEPISIQNITIVGSGTMGHGIGQDFALAGYPVNLYDVSAEQLQKALEKIERNYHEMAGWGLISEEEIQPALSRLHIFTVLQDAVQDADLVVEAVPEYLELKQKVFRQLDELCPPKTILASNTSSLMPSSLADVTRRPDRVLVLHYFFPPHLMPLVEIVRGKQTSEEVVQAVYAAAKKAKKKPIIAQKEALGFIANRMQIALLREALYIIEQGIASAQDVDIAVKESFGRRLSVVGPIELFEVQDGWDIGMQIDSYITPDLCRSTDVSPVMTEMVAKGTLGAKTGKGFYDWTPEYQEAFRRKLEEELADIARKRRDE
jgi:3-hydroxybutyryl-CoA dehydrogenase